MHEIERIKALRKSVAVSRSVPVAAFEARRRTPPSSGSQKGFAFLPPLMSNVRRLRGQGVSQRIIATAIDFAKSRGALTVEAYPVDPESPSYRFMGFVPAFEAAGFREVGRAGTRRHVFQLRVA
jgi:GNAT superfamily N-acetyltransferase